MSAFFAEKLSYSDVRQRHSVASVRVTLHEAYAIPREPKRIADRAEKTYLGSKSPLKIRAQLDRDIFLVNQPILVRVEVENGCKHEVNAIRISAKQEVTVRFNKTQKESYKCQVALLETTCAAGHMRKGGKRNDSSPLSFCVFVVSEGCPVKKHTTMARVFTILPTILKQVVSAKRKKSLHFLVVC